MWITIRTKTTNLSTQCRTTISGLQKAGQPSNGSSAIFLSWWSSGFLWPTYGNPNADGK